MYGLSNAVADVRRAYEVVLAQYNRYSAAETQVGAIRTSYNEGKASLDLLLEAQRRLVDAAKRERLKSGIMDYVCRDKVISSGPVLRGHLEHPSSLLADYSKHESLEPPLGEAIVMPHSEGHSVKEMTLRVIVTQPRMSLAMSQQTPKQQTTYRRT